MSLLVARWRGGSTASAGFTWSWGPTDTPPVTITTSELSSAAEALSSFCGAASAAAPTSVDAANASATM